jgi:hypothetical protein
MDATAKIELLSIENLYLNLFDIFILLFEELIYRKLEAIKLIHEEQAEEYAT